MRYSSSAGLGPRRQSVSFCSPSLGWVAGSDVIAHTEDGGRRWECGAAARESPTGNDLVSLFFISPRRGWAGGDKRTLLRLAE